MGKGSHPDALYIKRKDLEMYTAYAGFAMSVLVWRLGLQLKRVLLIILILCLFNKRRKPQIDIIESFSLKNIKI